MSKLTMLLFLICSISYADIVNNHNIQTSSYFEGIEKFRCYDLYSNPAKITEHFIADDFNEHSKSIYDIELQYNDKQTDAE